MEGEQEGLAEFWLDRSARAGPLFQGEYKTTVGVGEKVVSGVWDMTDEFAAAPDAQVDLSSISQSGQQYSVPLRSKIRTWAFFGFVNLAVIGDLNGSSLRGMTGIKANLQ